MDATAKDPLALAKELAIRLHGQQRYGDEPYEYHLRWVYATVLKFQRSGIDNDLVAAAAWVHDTLEDTGTQKDFVSAELGADIADLVWRVTDEPGETRKERKTKTYAKIRERREAVFLKLCDRIANVEAALANERDILEKYRKEFNEFEAGLRSRSDFEDMWRYLSALLRSSPRG